MVISFDTSINGRPYKEQVYGPFFLVGNKVGWNNKNFKKYKHNSQFVTDTYYYPFFFYPNFYYRSTMIKPKKYIYSPNKYYEHFEYKNNYKFIMSLIMILILILIFLFTYNI